MNAFRWEDSLSLNFRFVFSMKILAVFLLILSIPIVIITCVLIFFPKGKSILFKQKRVGIHKKEFVIYKFTTMENDSITKVGKIIRKLGWDEIPQLLNVIKGDMAFVGPRPLTASDINRLNWNTSNHAKRWSVKPGITGPAQLTNICDAKVSMSKDLFYIENKSILLDFKMIIRSLLVPIIGKRTTWIYLSTELEI